MDPQVDYLERYKVILENIIYFKENEILSSSGQIDYLYSVLKDLNKLGVLRREDINEKIRDEYFIDENGFIRKYKINSDYIEKFNTLHNRLISGIKTEEIPVEIKNKYEVIKEVFTKGQVKGFIHGERINYGFVSRLDNFESAYLDYKAMENFVKEDYSTLTQDFKKAYFLFKLGNFKKAFTLYSSLSQKYFNNKDYLMYYFSQINRYNSYFAIKSLSTYAGSVAGKLTGFVDEETLSEEDKIFMKDFSIDEIFDSLPLQFKKAYSSLKDLYNQKGLYKNYKC